MNPLLPHEVLVAEKGRILCYLWRLGDRVFFKIRSFVVLMSANFIDPTSCPVVLFLYAPSHRWTIDTNMAGHSMGMSIDTIRSIISEM